jgi:HEAT repeat protein
MKLQALVGSKAVEVNYEKQSTIARYTAVVRVIENKRIDAADFLNAVLLNDESALIRHEAAFGLGVLGARNYQDSLLTALGTDPDSIVRHEAAIALALVGGSQAIEPLKTATKDRDSVVAESAQYALKEISNKANVKIV